MVYSESMSEKITHKFLTSPLAAYQIWRTLKVEHVNGISSLYLVLVLPQKLFFLLLFAVADKIAQFVKETNFCATSTWVPESGPKLYGNSCCIIYASADKHTWNLQSFHEPS